MAYRKLQPCLESNPNLVHLSTGLSQLLDSEYCSARESERIRIGILKDIDGRKLCQYSKRNLRISVVLNLYKQEMYQRCIFSCLTSLGVFSLSGKIVSREKFLVGKDL